jgi:hypothetical protein
VCYGQMAQSVEKILRYDGGDQPRFSATGEVPASNVFDVQASNYAGPMSLRGCSRLAPLRQGRAS